VTAFARLAPYIREFLHRQGWSELRTMQVDAITAVLDTPNHILLAGQTASGKTEAAFLPILTELYERPSRTIGVLYVGPTKALINDQFERLDALLDEAGMEVWPWHGDVPQSVKKRALASARGVLQTTPESLEGFMLYRNQHLTSLFSDLRFVVIDEQHAFMQSDRGRQLQSLLGRIEVLTRAKFRRVGLSATLHDYDEAKRWLAGGSTTPAVVIQSDTKRRISLSLAHYRVPASNDEPNGVQDGMGALNDDMFAAVQRGKSLIFTNSRVAAERAGSALEQRSAPDGSSPRVFVHHGSVSKEYRLAAEAAMREPGLPAVTVATMTLELGIDLGQLDRVLQLHAPNTVSSLVQRMGRTGRRGQAGEIRVLTQDEASEKNAHPIELLPWDLLLSLASIQLYLEQRWVEPIQQPELPLSLLYQQTLSVLAQEGEKSPKALAERVLNLDPFVRVGKERYKRFLRHLLETRHLEWTEQGHFIVGMEAERTLQRYSFLATFEDPSEFTVRSVTSVIGTLSSAPPEESLIRLAGRTWRVRKVDSRRRHVLVEPSRGHAITKWSGGAPGIHRKIIERARDLLCEDTVPKYLSDYGCERLAWARAWASDHELLNRAIVASAHGSVVLLWSGTLEFDRVTRHVATGTQAAVSEVRDPVAFEVAGVAPKRLLKALQAEVPEADIVAGVREEELQLLGKYARFSPADLAREAFVLERLAPASVTKEALPELAVGVTGNRMANRACW
jgi:ATP-dependent helicase Lhr and Lhr-like helicase